jgi:hypothetical protein
MVPDVDSLIVLLESMLAGKMTPQQVIELWPTQSGNRLIEEVYAYLFHFRDDEDIRLKDSYYAESQVSEIRSFIQALSANGSKESQ